MKDYTKLNLDPHKEAKFAMFHWHALYANTRLGSMAFYETYLSDADRAYCEQAVARIDNARVKEENEK